MTMTFEQLQPDYAARWAAMAIRPDWEPRARAIAQRIVDARQHYEPVSGMTGVPWHVIGIIHMMECGGSFRGHLHNGDSLQARTHQVPAGRPRTGNPPFTWEESACDALRYDGLDKVADWAPERIAWCLERFNGMGYRNKGVPSAYLWSGSNQYSRGKYIRDGVWSSTAVSEQIGGMVLYKEMLALVPELTAGDKLEEAAAEFPKADKEPNPAADEPISVTPRDLKEQGSGTMSAIDRLLVALGLPTIGAMGLSIADAFDYCKEALDVLKDLARDNPRVVLGVVLAFGGAVVCLVLRARWRLLLAAREGRYQPQQPRG